MNKMFKNPPFQSLAFDFKALDIFQAVYACASMTEAARQLDLTQSAVSQAISRLEVRLGLTLFERTRPLAATPAADHLAQQSARFFDAAQQMENSVRERAHTGRPIVRIGLIDSFAATVGPKLIPRLRGQADRLTVWSGISRNLEKELRAGKLDMMVGTQPLSQEKGIVAYPLLREPYLIVLPDHMARSMIKTVGEVRLRDLVQNHTFVRYSMRSKIGVDIEHYLQHLGQVPPQSLEFDGTEAAFAMVNGGLGWMISTPLCLIHGNTVETGLTAVPLPVPAPERTLFLLARKDLEFDVVQDTLEEAQRIVRALMQRRLRQLAPWALDMVG